MKKFILLLIVPFLSFGQCIQGDCKNGYGTGIFTDKTKYTGEWKDGKRVSGKMFDENGDLVFEGQWKNNQVYSGNGKLIIDKDNGFEGEWRDGEYWSGKGKMTYQNGGWFDGEWEGGNASTGKAKEYYEDGQIAFEGDYQDGEIWEGTLYENYDGDTNVIDIRCNSMQEIILYDGKRNDFNYYEKEDIIGASSSTVVKLKQKEIDNNWYKMQNHTNYITLIFGDVEKEWVFDTGAEGFSISIKDWNQIKDKLSYEELGICRNTVGVGGTSSGKLVRINEIQIGDYLIKNIIAEIAPNYSLLGIDFLNKFKNTQWDMDKKTLKLYK